MSKLPRINTSRAPTPQSTKDTINTTALTTENYPSKSPLVYEAKLNQLETKLITLEQSNTILLNRISQIEASHDHNINQIHNKILTLTVPSMKPKLEPINDNKEELALLHQKIIFLETMLQKQSKWINESRVNDVDIYRKILNKVSEKICEVVQLEVTNRLKSELTGEMIASKMIAKYDEEIESLRNEFKTFSTDMKVDMAHFSSECVERNEKVSRYVDDKFDTGATGSNQKSKNLEQFMLKLTEQIRTNLINQTNKNEEYENKFNKLNGFLKQFKTDTYSFLNQIETRLVNQLREVKQYFDINLKESNHVLNKRINSLSDNTDINFKAVSNYLSSTLSQINKNFDSINIQNSSFKEQVVSDLDTIVNRIYQVENALNTQSEDLKQHKVDIDKKISTFASEVAVYTANERIVHSIQNQIFGEKIETFRKYLLQTQSDVKVNLSEMNKISEDSYDVLIDRINALQNIVNNMAIKTDEKIKRLATVTSQIEVRQTIDSMLSANEDILIIEEMNKMKGIDHFLHLRFTDLKNEIDSIAETIEQKDKENSSSAKNLQDMLTEKEEKQQVYETLQIMISNVEHELMKTNINNVKNEVYELKDQLGVITETNAKNDEAASKKAKHMKEVDEVNAIVNEMVTKVEFENVYSAINSMQTSMETLKEEIPPKKDTATLNELEALKVKIQEGNETTKKVLVDYAGVIDTKISNAMEKIKKENIDMWTNAVTVANTVTAPEEIKKIVKSVPPVVLPMSSTLKAIMEVGFEHDNPKPFVKEVKDTKKKIEEERYGTESKKEEAPAKKTPSKASSKKASNKGSKTPSKNSNIS